MISFFLLSAPLMYAGNYSLTVHVDTAGTLKNKIDPEIKDSVVSLVLSGELNGSDILFIREMAGSDKNGKPTGGNLSDLNLSKATIREGGLFYYLYYSTIENKIGNYMFYKCPKLRSVILPETAVFMGFYAFSECKSLESVYISKSIMGIGTQAFYKCPDFKAIYVDKDNETMASADGVLFDKNITRLILYPCQKQDSLYTIPSTVKSVDTEAFYNCDALKSLNMTNSVTFIGSSSFYDCSNLEYVNFSKNITLISEKAFSRCSKLQLIDLPYGLITIGKEAFSECTSLTSAIIQQQVTTIGERAFWLCTSLQSIAIPESVKTIENSAFSSCESLKTAIIPSSLEFIGGNIFGGCGLTSVFIPGDIKVIRGGMFNACTELEEVFIGEGITKIEDGVFSGCKSLSSITLPQSVIEIGLGAFMECKGLKHIFIPKDVRSIGKTAFNGCKDLESFTVDSLNMYYCSREGVLLNKDATTIISYPNNKSKKYVIPGYVNHIGDYAFYQCDISDITFNDYVETVGDYAFFKCNSLMTISLPCVVSIDSHAFACCQNLKSISMPFLNETKGSVFYSCPSLDSIIISKELTKIDIGVFSYCTNLKCITIGENVDTIAKGAFRNCISLRKIYCMNPEPAVVINDVFLGVNIDSCKLIVPKGALTSYSSANIWSYFKQIEEDETVVLTNHPRRTNPSINVYNGVITVGDMPLGSVAEIYTLSGKPIGTLRAGNNNSVRITQKGIYIIKIRGTEIISKIVI